jgi:hypothetical protein
MQVTNFMVFQADLTIVTSPANHGELTDSLCSPQSPGVGLIAGITGRPTHLPFSE